MDKATFIGLGNPIKKVKLDGNEFGIRRLTVKERLEALAIISGETDDSRSVKFDNARKSCAYLIVHGVVDENGNRIFGDKETELINEMDCVIGDFLTDEIMYHSGLAKKSEDEAIKN